MNPIERAAREAAHEGHVFATIVTLVSIGISALMFVTGGASGPNADLALRLALTR